MLDPHQRRLLTEVVRAPDGYEFDQAIACTYSLDLLALASIPLLAQGHESETWSASSDEVGEDSQLAGIECLRRDMSRYTVFCQSGAIHVPERARPLFLWLERSVVEVQVPAGRHGPGVFHPKLWLFRFVNDTSEVRYRLIVLSRNLTFDRSWDVVATLEGEFTGRKNRIASSVPISEFVNALGSEIPSIRSLAPAHKDRVKLFAEEVARVQFLSNEEIESWIFWPIGIRGHRYSVDKLFTSKASPFASWFEKSKHSGRDLMVVSPFLGPNLLGELKKVTEHHKLTLVSSEVSLDRWGESLPPKLLDQEETYIWSFAPQDVDGSLLGLHAKLWIADDGYEAHVWIGSANATDAAFSRNVEVLLQLSGRKSKLGTSSLLSGSTSNRERERIFRDLLVPFRNPRAPDAEALEVEQRQRALDYQLMELIAKGEMYAFVTAGSKCHELRLDIGKATGLLARPATLVEAVASVRGRFVGNIWCFSDLRMDELTEFWVLTLRDGDLVSSSVSRIPAEGMPAFEHRSTAVVSRHLNSLDSLGRYLAFLLATDGSAIQTQLREERRRRVGARRGVERERPLMETLLRALVHRPEVLDDVSTLLESVDKSEATWVRDASFQAMWSAFQAARLLVIKKSVSGAPRREGVT